MYMQSDDSEEPLVGTFHAPLEFSMKKASPTRANAVETSPLLTSSSSSVSLATMAPMLGRSFLQYSQTGARSSFAGSRPIILDNGQTRRFGSRLKVIWPLYFGSHISSQSIVSGSVTRSFRYTTGKV